MTLSLIEYSVLLIALFYPLKQMIHEFLHVKDINVITDFDIALGLMMLSISEFVSHQTDTILLLTFAFVFIKYTFKQTQETNVNMI